MWFAVCAGYCSFAKIISCCNPKTLAVISAMKNRIIGSGGGKQGIRGSENQLHDGRRLPEILFENPLLLCSRETFHCSFCAPYKNRWSFSKVYIMLCFFTREASSFRYSYHYASASFALRAENIKGGRENGERRAATRKLQAKLFGS